MRIDAHQHFWRYNVPEYAWIGPGMEVLERDYLPADLAPLLLAAGVDGTVAVQARQTLAETAWLLELARQYPFIRGVVGWVDLCSPEVAAQLDAFAGQRGPQPGIGSALGVPAAWEPPRLVGVRHLLHDEPDDRYMLRPDFLRGIGELARFDLCYDLLVYPRHLANACELVRRFPGQRFVLDHIAKPPIRDGLLEPWASDIRRLAAHPNVCCKVSGLVTEADWQSWRPADLRPYLDTVFEAFGAERLMMGSDWPVCTLAGEYGEVVGVTLDYVASLSEAEQALVLGETARREYRLR